MRVFFGGTFDPVHIGHLRMATELREILGVDSVYLMPCFDAVHKKTVTSSANRLDMLNLAVCDDAGIQIDDREIKRNIPSYTIDSLVELREEVESESLVMVMGSDSLLDLALWKGAEHFSGLANLIFINRPGVVFDEDVVGAELSRLGFTKACALGEMKSSSKGLWFQLSLTALDVSSTEIRKAVYEGKSIRYLLKDAVRQYICDNELYSA